MQHNTSFTTRYQLGQSLRSAPNSCGINIKYQMGWLGIFGKDDDDDNKKDDSDSGIRIDWDTYDRINTPDTEPEDRGVIEVPANAETIIYESPDGETYEIPISDLIDADDEGEIECETKDKHKPSVLESGYKFHKKIQKHRNRFRHSMRSHTMFVSNQHFARVH